MPSRRVLWTNVKGEVGNSSLVGFKHLFEETNFPFDIGSKRDFLRGITESFRTLHTGELYENSLCYKNYYNRTCFMCCCSSDHGGVPPTHTHDKHTHRYSVTYTMLTVSESVIVSQVAAILLTARSVGLTECSRGQGGPFSVTGAYDPWKVAGTSAPVFGAGALFLVINDALTHLRLPFSRFLAPRSARRQAQWSGPTASLSGRLEPASWYWNYYYNYYDPSFFFAGSIIFLSSRSLVPSNF
jgi:hypothetical protein